MNKKKYAPLIRVKRRSVFGNSLLDVQVLERSQIRVASHRKRCERDPSVISSSHIVGPSS